jgi:excisionase family DNA binding protein
MARKHTKPARVIERKATPVLSLKFDGRMIPLRSPESARLLLAELCETATQNMQTFHAVQREVEAQRVRMRESALAHGITTEEAAKRCGVCRATIDRAVAAGELHAVVNIGHDTHYRVIRPEALDAWNRARLARKRGTDTP